MKNTIIIIVTGITLAAATSIWAMDKKNDHAAQGHDTMNHATEQPAAAHDRMEHGGKHEGGTYKHMEMVDGIHAEFQMMDLASMNMKDPEGKTHHIMVSFMKGDGKIEQAAGKIKVIAPSGKEQTATLQDFGSGVFAANFSFDEPGKWGVICLFKDDAGKHMVKFWYPHMTM